MVNYYSWTNIISLLPLFIVLDYSYLIKKSLLIVFIFLDHPFSIMLQLKFYLANLLF